MSGSTEGSIIPLIECVNEGRKRCERTESRIERGENRNMTDERHLSLELLCDTVDDMSE